MQRLKGSITFTIEYVDTSETREVTAWSRKRVADLIADGEFDNA